MAHLKTKATTGKSQEREQWKWRLVRGLYDRGYNRDNIIKLFQLIDQMMALPEELQQSFEERLTRYEEERQMPLLSHMEERAIQRGREEGLQQTRQILRSSIINILQVRFEAVPPELIEAINSIEDISELQRLLLETVSVNSVADFEQLLSQNPNN